MKEASLELEGERRLLLEVQELLAIVFVRGEECKLDGGVSWWK